MKKQNREMLEKENEEDYMQFDAKFTTLGKIFNPDFKYGLAPNYFLEQRIK